MSFPPRALNADRSGLMAFTVLPNFSSTTFRSRSISKLLQSQSVLSYVTQYDPSEMFGGALSRPITTSQSASLPYSFPGKTISPDFVFAAEYMRFTVSICGAVKQLSESPALQSNVAGSNLQVRGSFRMLSFT